MTTEKMFITGKDGTTKFLVSVVGYCYPYNLSCSTVSVDWFMVVVDGDENPNEVINKGKAVPVRN
jgi:hypothetical protein